jgi:uncharacterized protein with HEPN domain
MQERVRQRLADIIEANDNIDALLSGKGEADFEADRHMRAAFERYIEILSEASRSIPDGIKVADPDINWRNVADIGNHLRHAYHRVDPDILWNTYTQGRLQQTKAFCQRALEA